MVVVAASLVEGVAARTYRHVETVALEGHVEDPYLGVLPEVAPAGEDSSAAARERWVVTTTRGRPRSAILRMVTGELSP